MYICAFLIMFTALGQSDWIKYTDIYETFSVEVPGDVEVTEDKFIIDIGEIEVVTHKCLGKANDPNELYTVQEYDYPDGFLHRDSTDLMKELIQASLQESINKLNGELDYQRSINVYEHPGILYRISFANRKKVMKGKVLIVDGTYYSLQVYTNIDNSLNERIDKFLDSFTLIF